uniref:Nuclear receptor domain-containing protein n=1 Tax=Caenorhabditis japonica TaxID=281687 RepID=A0A8R1EM86_CAEJA
MENEEVCLVCQDVSSGYHYGIPSCNGCKTFFRRTVMKKQRFVCQFDQNCLVDKSIRCACKFCRFEKCLKVGMNKSALQASRDPIGYTKRTKRVERRPMKELSDTESPSLSVSPSPERQEPQTSGFENYLSLLASREKNANELRLSSYLPKRSLKQALCSKPLLNDPIFMSKHATVSPRHNYTELRFITQDDYHYWHERDWFVLTEYAKTFKVFNSLSYHDKAELVRHAAIVIPVLNQVYNSPDHGLDTVVFPDGTYYDRTHEPTRPAGLNRKKYQVLDLVLKPFREMEINFNEFSSFKAITFLNPGNSDFSAFHLFFWPFLSDADVSLDAKKAINDERVLITKQLYGYMLKKDGLEKAILRFSRLILMGTSMSKMACESKEAVWIADFFENIGFTSFAKELFFGEPNSCATF